MPVITPTKFPSKGSIVATEITLDGATDSFTYVDGETTFLILRNDTAGPLSPVLDGADSGIEYCPGIGDIDTTAGYTVDEIVAGTTAVVDLHSIRMYLKGGVVVTGGTGLVAILESTR